MAGKQAVKEVVDEPLARWSLKLGATKTEYLVAVETDRAVLSHRLGVATWRCPPASVGIVVLAVDLDHDSGSVGRQQQEVHALPRKLAAGKRRELTLGVWVVVQIDLRNERRDVLSAVCVPSAVSSEEQLLGRAGQRVLESTVKSGSGLTFGLMRGLRSPPLEERAVARLAAAACRTRGSGRHPRRSRSRC